MSAFAQKESETALYDIFKADKTTIGACDGIHWLQGWMWLTLGERGKVGKSCLMIQVDIP